jgi:VCBS repeat-containing protein
MANVTGTNSKDILAGTNSKDVIVALDDDDGVAGLGGNDSIDGGNGLDSLFGGTGNDTLLGGAGADLIHGGAGNDLIGSSDGSRNASPGPGPGDVIYGDGFNNFTIVSGNVVGQDPTATTQRGDDVIYGTAQADTIYGDNGDNLDSGASGGHDTVVAGNSADTVYGEGGNDSISGEGGNDLLVGGEGKDTLSGGDGNDTLIGGAGADVIDGGPGDDRIVYDAASDSAGNKNDTITGFVSGLNYSSGDKIDITGLVAPGTDIFWLGGMPASPVPHSAWSQSVAGGVNLMVDSSGDSAADLQVFLQGITSLKHSDVLGLFNSPLLVTGEINNAGDAVIEGAGAAAGDPLATGYLSIYDWDGDLLQASNPGTQQGTYGSLVITPEGSWTYTLDDSRPATQTLTEGATVVDEFEVAYTDGLATNSTLPVRITVTGANDPAVITGDTSGLTNEDQTRNPGPEGIEKGLPATGILYSLDVDGIDDLFEAVTVGTSALGFGTYQVTSSGEWTYTLDNTNPEVQRLTAGDAPVDHFTVHAADGTAQIVSVTVIGQNDVPVVLVPGTQGTNEDTALVFGSATGNPITVADEDSAVLHVTVGAPLAVGLPHLLTLAQTAGLHFTLGDGFADDRISFSGSAADVNAALDGLIFMPAPDYSGTATLGIFVDDGTTSAAEGVFINVNPVDDGPDHGGGGIPPVPVPVILSFDDVFSESSVGTSTVNYALPSSESGILSDLLNAGKLTAY